MKVINGTAQGTRRTKRGWMAPSRVELFDDEGRLLGVILMARTTQVAGAGAETVYLHREIQPERLRQSA